jgi:hypothetical protein
MLEVHRDRQSIFSKYPPPGMLFYLAETTSHATADDTGLTADWPSDLPVVRQDSANHPGTFANGILSGPV